VTLRDLSLASVRAHTAARHIGPAQGTDGHGRSPCCSRYHHAVELIGKRWSGAILLVLLDGPSRFCEITQLVPDLSDRLLSERLKELEAEGIVERRPEPGDSARVRYALSDKGRALEPALRALESWSQSHL
jgi:DNA-binding HxlR family transcriptional regulator